MKALKSDFNKPHFESFATEIAQVYKEIGYSIKHLKSWMRAEKVSSPIELFPTSSKIIKDSKGSCSCYSPLELPCTIDTCLPIVNALSAGNAIVLKLPNETRKTSEVIQLILHKAFEKDHVDAFFVEDKDVVPRLFEEYRFNHVFFTGSEAVSKIIRRACIDKSVPLTLELGGKSPCIVDQTANLKIAAKRIVWSKMVNAGQTCVAPDYVVVHEKVADELNRLLRIAIEKFSGKSAEIDFPRIINKKNFDRLVGLINQDKVTSGGSVNAGTLYIQPTIMEGVDLDDECMKEEIFGPILPVLTYQNSEQLNAILDTHQDPLAFYVYSKNKGFINRILKERTFGGSCINNGLIHLGNPELPFGGVGHSGFGSYHGKRGFDTFSIEKSVSKTGNWFDLPIKYPPYTEGGLKLLKRILK